ncbi:MAG: citrate/2-methylcitrate synthase [Agathobaculum sp.]|jgi:citrate synthase|uniref:citrate/2-methylcitrate synthase n=1 Tax=Agathobaculum sp. TaxID=2048138 RepID=UPI003D8ECFE3
MTVERDVLEVTPQIEALASLCKSNSAIDAKLYKEFDVKRGLRDINGKGVLAGLTNISDIISAREVDGKLIPCEGELYYRGININDLVSGFMKDGRKGYEETAYLLLFGELPDARRLADFKSLLARGRTLPTNFTRDVIMKAPTHDMMNSLSRSVLTLASYDNRADDISLPNVLRQCLMLISVFPMLAVYSYHAYNHYECGGSMYIHYPSDSLSTASNFLRILRPDMQYTPLEASVLDLALVLHMEHGGGNNSSFTTHVVTSSGTDTYSTVAAALGSLKGPKHGGANYKVVQMFNDLKQNVSDPTDDEQVADYLCKLLRREAFDHKGLIYGMGHAVYSISDPRAQVFKSFVGKLAHEKGRDADFALYSSVARLAPQVIAQERRIYKGVSANVDFYSGFVYSMLGLPPELYTPVFAMARIVGWSAHRLEELINTDKIIRPAYRCVLPETDYVALSER